MTLELSHDKKAEKWSFTYKPHVVATVGYLFIAGGIATFNGPWWQGILEAFLGEANIVVNNEYQWLPGIALILTGLSIVSYKYLLIDVRNAEIKADRATLESAPIPINKISSYFRSLVDDHSFLSSDDTLFQDSYTHFLRQENIFRLKDTAQAYERYSESAKCLHQFTQDHFYIFPDSCPPDNDYRYCMEPELNIDRAMVESEPSKKKKYSNLKEELDHYVETTQNALSLFVAELKKRGHV